MKKSWIVIALIIGILILDQWLKIYIKTTFALGGGFDILGQEWAKIHFVENKGMAFGIELGGNMGKLVLSLFRVIMIAFLGYLLYGMIKAGESLGLLVSFGLILAGAIGNMIDSAFYGMIFSHSYHGNIAEMFPPDGGYGTFLHGKVVDMFYFPMIRSSFPNWLPVWGGQSFEFFRPVFNIADAAISTGVISILLFHRSFFSGEKNEDSEVKDSVVSGISEEE